MAGTDCRVFSFIVQIFLFLWIPRSISRKSLTYTVLCYQRWSVYCLPLLRWPSFAAFGHAFVLMSERSESCESAYALNFQQIYIPLFDIYTYFVAVKLEWVSLSPFGTNFLFFQNLADELKTDRSMLLADSSDDEFWFVRKIFYC